MRRADVQYGLDINKYEEIKQASITKRKVWMKTTVAKLTVMLVIGILLGRVNLLLNQSQSISFNLIQSLSIRARDCSENTAKAGALGHRERQSDRRKLLSATMSPIAKRLRSCSGKPDGEA